MLQCYAAELTFFLTGDSGLADQITKQEAFASAGVQFVPGRAGKALRFDGSESYVAIPWLSTFSVQPFTVECWVNLNSLTNESWAPGNQVVGDQYLVFKRNSRTNNFEGFTLLKNRWAGDCFGMIVASRSGEQLGIRTANITTNRWYHLAGVYDGTNISLYLNGQLQDSAVVPFELDFGNRPLFLGRSGEIHDNPLDGMLDEVALHSGALSENQIRSIYHGTAQRDQTVLLRTNAIPPLVAEARNEPVSVSLHGEKIQIAYTDATSTRKGYRLHLESSTNLSAWSPVQAIGQASTNATNHHVTLSVRISGKQAAYRLNYQQDGPVVVGEPKRVVRLGLGDNVPDGHISTFQRDGFTFTVLPGPTSHLMTNGLEQAGSGFPVLAPGSTGSHDNGGAWLAADKHYGTASNYRYCAQQNIRPHLGEATSGMEERGLFTPEKFRYDAEKDRFECPAGNWLVLHQRRPEINCNNYLIERAELCLTCPLRDKCTKSKAGRSLQAPSDYQIIEKAKKESRSPAARRSRKRRKHVMEGSFADASNNHGSKRARWRRLWRQEIQCWMIAVVQNLRILIKRTNKNGNNAAGALNESRNLFRELKTAAINPGLSEEAPYASMKLRADFGQRFYRASCCAAPTICWRKTDLRKVSWATDPKGGFTVKRTPESSNPPYEEYPHPAPRRRCRARRHRLGRSNRSRFITLFHAATKSRTNFPSASALA